MASSGVVMKNRRTTFERVDKFISPTYWTDCNLYGKLYPLKADLTTLTHFTASGRIPFTEAKKASFDSTAVGKSFGPTYYILK
jgi:alpha-mannosidase